jgi:tetratricopeptide (TPR) repeat protein
MRMRPMVGWGIFLFLVAIIIHLVPTPRAAYYYIKGSERLAARDYEAAAGAFRESVDSDPNFARGYVELGASYYALEKYPEAEQAFKQAMSIKEDSCAACGLGMIYRVQGRRDEAETSLRNSIKLDPKDSCPYNQLGRMYYDAEEYPKAIEAFEQELKLVPNAVSYHFLANSLYYNKRVEDSIASYQKATLIDPKFEKALLDLGRAYLDLRRYPQATDCFQRAVKLDPEDQKAHSFLAVTQFISGNKQGAMEEYMWLLKKNPTLAAELLRGFYELEDEAHKAEKTKLGERRH